MKDVRQGNVLYHGRNPYRECGRKLHMVQDPCYGPVWGFGKPLKAVGVITDIDKEKNMIDALRRRAERDAPDRTLQQRGNREADPPASEGGAGGICALFMIDTDNFKQINDCYGHLFGDAVLSELATGMKRLTRQSDVVGRIGGDEFTVFFKEYPFP